MMNILKRLVNWIPAPVVVLFIVIVADLTIFQVANLVYDITTSTEYSEAGYLVKKTTDNCFYYDINDEGVGSPEFKDEYFFTIFVDSKYIRFEVPYEVFTRFKLGDHILTCKEHKSLVCSNYFGVIYNIKIPAEIMED